MLMLTTGGATSSFFGLIFFVGISVIMALGIWSFILHIIALSKLQGITRLTSFGIIVAVGIIIYVIILAFSVTLGGLFSLGLFSPGTSSFVATICIPSTGYTCSTPIYSHATGQLTVTIGQNTGTSWESWGVAYAPTGTGTASNGSPDVEYYAMNGSLGSGMEKTVTLPVSASVPVGSVASGRIWVCYYTSTSAGVVGGMGGCTPANGAGQSAVYYAQLATLTTRAT